MNSTGKPAMQPASNCFTGISPKVELGCVIMASGLGRRFGGNKLTANFGGRPMIEWILLSTKDVCARAIVITRHADVYEICMQQGVDAILHDLPRRSDTIRLGLQAIMEGIQGCMFCPGDQPPISQESLTSLTASFYREPNCIHRLGGGTPVIFPAWTFDELLHLPEGSGGNAVIQRYPESVRTVAPAHPWELMDADTPEMLVQLEKHIPKR